MNYRGGVITGVLGTLLIAGVGLGIYWLLTGKSFEAKKNEVPPIPANVVAQEGQFNLITLKPEAEKNLNIAVGKVVKKAMPQTRMFCGEVMIPPGRTIVVSAPFSGILQRAGEETLTAGVSVTKNESVFELVPLLTPDGRANLAAALVEAQGQINNALSQKKAALIVRDRAEKLLMDDAGSKRQFDDAVAAYELSESVLAAAEERKKKLLEFTGKIEKGNAAAMAINAPASGQLRNVVVAHGQHVPQGAVLFEVLDLNTVWVRVPVFVDEEIRLKEAAPARIGNLTASPENLGAEGKNLLIQHLAKRVNAPPTANLLSRTVDLYFELDNRLTKYRPGQPVGVTLDLKTEPLSLVVPWAAVLYDINGGAWVYERTAEHTYLRRRVMVRNVVDDTAVLLSGPPEGTIIVTDGAVELFGTETGYSK